jgi:hypothetical protein
VRRLRAQLGDVEGVWLGILEGDLFSIADLLDRAQRFVFVDAVVREPPGQLVFEDPGVPLVAAASLHQTDIVAVMQRLQALEIVDPFPIWSLWGITIRLPRGLGVGLSEPVERSAQDLCERLGALVRVTSSDVNRG